MATESHGGGGSSSEPLISSQTAEIGRIGVDRGILSIIFPLILLLAALHISKSLPHHGESGLGGGAGGGH